MEKLEENWVLLTPVETTSTTKPPIEQQPDNKILPHKVLVKIFRYCLDPAELCRYSLVCKSWLSAAEDNSLWKKIYNKRWGQENASALEQKEWRQKYSQKSGYDSGLNLYVFNTEVQTSKPTTIKGEVVINFSRAVTCYGVFLNFWGAESAPIGEHNPTGVYTYFAHLLSLMGEEKVSENRKFCQKFTLPGKAMVIPFELPMPQRGSKGESLPPSYDSPEFKINYGMTVIVLRSWPFQNLTQTKLINVKDSQDPSSALASSKPVSNRVSKNMFLSTGTFTMEVSLSKDVWFSNGSIQFVLNVNNATTKSIRNLNIYLVEHVFSPNGKKSPTKIKRVKQTFNVNIDPFSSLLDYGLSLDINGLVLPSIQSAKLVQTKHTLRVKALMVFVNKSCPSVSVPVVIVNPPA